MNRRREISEYLDGRLLPAQRQQFEVRLGTDPGLAAEVEETRRAVALLRSLPMDAAPDDLVARVMGQVRQKPVPARRWLVWEFCGRWLHPARLAMATAAVALVVGAGLLSRPEPPGPRLDKSDEAFIKECLQDYHVEARKQLDGHGPVSSDTLPPEF